ncbi:MAG: PAS domain S-box protein, partial [Syntrophales bacterium]
MMVGMRGSELLVEVQKRFPHTIRILLTGHATLEASMQAVNEGQVYRFLTKPWDEAMLRLSLSAATEKYNSDAERRRLQDALQQSEERYRTVVEQSPQAVIVHRDGTIIYANPAAIKMFGATSPQDLAGKPLLDLVHPDEHQAVLARLQTVTLRGVISPIVERRYLRLDRSVFTGEIQGTPILYDGLPAIHLAIHDITDRKQAEKALQEAHDLLEQRVEERTNELRKSEERLQLAIVAADVGIFEFDVAGNRFTWDATICRFYGIPSDKLGGSYAAWEAAIHPEDLPMMRESLQRALRGGGEYNHEFRVVWPDGSIHWHRSNALVERDSQGRALRMTGTTLDITADKLLVEAAEVASRAKSLFIGNMSHELRTPLSGVLGMTEALLNTPVTQQQRDYAETIRKSGKALLAVVGNILDFSKIEAGNMALNSAPFLVESVIANVVNLFGPSAAEEKIGLHTTMAPEIPVLRGDTHRLTQVVSNLVGNAIKFTKKGEIQVTAKILRRTETEVELAIGVQDTGIGMTEEELSRIFTGFTQGDTTRGRRFGGTGLGLTISRNLVELMGGTLQVESVFGKGSLFTVLVTFPIAQGFAVSDLQFLQTSAPSATISPVAPAPPARPERPPGDMAELQTLLEQL